MNKHDDPLHALRQAVLAKRAQQRMQSAVQAVDPRAIRPAGRDGALPLSWGQKRLWILDQLDPAASVAYHIPFGIRLTGRLDVAALRATLDRIVARHETLRTSFPHVGEEPVQRIAPADAGFVLGEQDLGDLDHDAQHEAVARIGADEAGAPFDLARGPLIRGQLLRLSETEHVLLVTQHHIVSDGWSIGVLVGEVSALYAAFSAAQADPLPPLAVQYADYALWQRQWLQGEVLEQRLQFWRDHLDGAPGLLELPTDRPRPAVQDYAGGSASLTLPADLAAGLRALGQRHGATLFMTLLAGWATLLSRLGGQDDVVIGTPVANRQRNEIEPLIGFFVNMVALRIAPGAATHTAQLLQQVKATALAAYDHQDVPFDLVVERLNPVRTMSHSPVFQTIVSMNNAVGDGALALPGLTLAPEMVATTTAQFELVLTLTETAEGIVANLGYMRSLFDRDTVVGLLECLRELLAGMVADESMPIARLPLMTRDAGYAVLRQGHGPLMAVDATLLAQHLFEQQVACNADATAVIHATGRLSYGELDQRANNIAHFLIGLGVKADDRVALCMTRGPDLVVAMLGILKSGAAYVPLNPAFPSEQLAFVLEDSAAVVLLTDAASQDRLPAMSMLRTVVVDEDDAAEIARHPASAPTPAPVSEPQCSLAYVLYTSGSTGRPNGVAVEHRHLRNYLAWAKDHYAAGTRIDAVVASPFAFDATVTSLYLPLITGGAVVLVADGEELEELPRRLRELAPGALCKITPAHLLALCEQLALAGQTCPAHLFVVGGEALPAATVTALQAVASGARVINEYGPTETVVGCVVHEADGTRQGDGSVPIGRPIANTRIYVLDREMQPVPRGAVGEIFIAGDGVARGYLNRPELTLQRFRDDPFAREPGARMYQSGDLGRWRDDGTLEYAGRADFQIKIRGFRIEPGEIEAVLCQCDGVRAAAVVAREDESAHKRLVAYVVADDDGAFDVAAVRARLARRLPDYMLPGAFVLLEAFPLSRNGKLDRKALPAPADRQVAARSVEPPESAVEIAVAAIWADLLGVDSVGRHDSFFELGGHSLMAITLVGHLRRIGFDAEVRDVFTRPTLAGFCAALATGATPDAASPANHGHESADATIFEEFRI